MSIVCNPSPKTFASLAGLLLEAWVDSNKYIEEMKELARTTDANMKELLGSYRLTKKNDGSYVLRRGSWFVHDWCEFNGHTATVYFETAIKDVGVDSSILPADQRYLLDKYKDDSDRSPNIGRWDRTKAK